MLQMEMFLNKSKNMRMLVSHDRLMLITILFYYKYMLTRGSEHNYKR